ncbi:hypothetical protein G6F68_016887 [Rhizopus microsporus]|nr:hypothetical protein G6F31_013639 [Rhizopus arrhizus]KAG1241245.1 hypothetical protein G6F68_016887 [Rhizopus microsporus]
MARALDELGVDIIETGFPASSQSDREAMALIGRELRRPSLSLAVLSRCLQADIETSARALEAAANPRLHVFLYWSRYASTYHWHARTSTMSNSRPRMPPAPSWIT